MMKIETMEDLFLEQVEDLYDAEKRLVKALPKMAEASTSLISAPSLRIPFDGDRRPRHAAWRISSAQLGQDPKSQTCDAMKGLISEGEDVVSDIDESSLRDAGLIAAANRVEHYEIAAYGSARTFAEILGLTEAAALLDQTLQEEKKADQKLTQSG